MRGPGILELFLVSGAIDQVCLSVVMLRHLSSQQCGDNRKDWWTLLGAIEVPGINTSEKCLAHRQWGDWGRISEGCQKRGMQYAQPKSSLFDVASIGY